MRSADLILENANVVDVEAGTSAVASIAVSGERLLAVGRPDEIASLRRPGSRAIDLTGKTVIPGLIDAHAHVEWTGLMAFAVDLRPAKSVRAVQELVAARAREQPEGTLLTGWGLQDNPLGEARLPTKEELDAVAPRHYVRLQRDDGHACVVNTLTLERLGYTAETPGMEMVSGRSTGVLRAQANQDAESRLQDSVTPEMSERGLHAAASDALKVGLTTVHALEGADATSLEQMARLRGALEALPIRTVLWYQTSHVDRAKALGLRRIGGCLLLDGAPGSYTGALFEPYSDRPQTSGILYFSDQAIREFVLEAHKEGLQIAVHATCQRSVEQAISAYENALKAHPRADHRHRIEHCSVCPPPLLERLREVGAIVVTQPAFIYYSGERYLKDVPDTQRPWLYRTRSFLESGLHPAGSSDCPVSPCSPLAGVYAAVTRKAESGQVLSPEEAVSARDALKLYTLGGAYASFEEQRKGSIEVGKLADLVVLSADPTAVEPQEICGIRVEKTIVGGEIVWER